MNDMLILLILTCVKWKRQFVKKKILMPTLLCVVYIFLLRLGIGIDTYVWVYLLVHLKQVWLK